MITMKTGATVAAAAAAIALSSVAVTPVLAGHAPVHCYGVNSCKGTSDCKSYNHDCKGMNSCKGQGYKELSKKACLKEGGSLTQPAG